MPDSDVVCTSSIDTFKFVRQKTEQLCDPLEVEDYVAQSNASLSPVKWHLAHTTLLLERWLLAPMIGDYKPVKLGYESLFCDSLAVSNRGGCSRPSALEVFDYRQQVNERSLALLSQQQTPELQQRLNWVLALEQRHQEEILTSIKHLFHQFSLPYHSKVTKPSAQLSELNFTRYAQQIVPVGCTDGAFCFANEQPRHEVLVQAFELSDRPVCNQDVLQFVEQGGYASAEFWSEQGWQWVQKYDVKMPAYWRNLSGWQSFTLSGWQALNPSAPACHLNYFEAHAIASWLGGRLPTEFEWEWAASEQQVEGNLLEQGILHPVSCGSTEGMLSLFGDVWHWTQSGYEQYIGRKTPQVFRQPLNAVDNHFVLRGGSCFTSKAHTRATYRMHLPGEQQWFMSGLRVARSL